MDFLTGCQQTRQDGGISGTGPSAVTDQVGVNLRVVDAFRQAWIDIQNLHTDWKWMRGEFSFQASAGTADYTLSTMGATDLDRVISVSAYLTASGPAGEWPVGYLPYDDFRAQFVLGAQTNGKPAKFTERLAGGVVLGKTPDDIYTVRGLYYTTAVSLAANTDIPAMPERFHHLIVDRAVMAIGGHFGDAVKVKMAEIRYLRGIGELERFQRDPIKQRMRPLA